MAAPSDNLLTAGRFAEMAGIRLGVAALSFVIGLLVKSVLGVDV